LRSFNGSTYCDIRILELRDGKMLPNGKGITVSAKQLGKFAKLVGDAYRKAAALGETK
jgi:Transcriptional Coactivator p15 (PC4)